MAKVREGAALGSGLLTVDPLLLDPPKLILGDCRKKAEDLGSADKYSFPGESGYGVVLANKRLYPAEGTVLPFTLEDIAGPWGVRLLEEMTTNRLTVPPFSGAKQERSLPNIRHWLETYPEWIDSPIISETESFRRHILNLPAMVMGEQALLEHKVRGMDPTHNRVSANDFVYALEMADRYGNESGVSEPLLMVDYPTSTYMLYGEKVKAAPRVIVFAYEDNQRLMDRDRGPVGAGYLKYVAGSNNLGFEELVGKIACDTLCVLGKIHSNEILLKGEAYLWNFILTENASTKFVSDFQEAERISSPDEYGAQHGEELGELRNQLMKQIVEPNIGDKTRAAAVMSKADMTYLTTVSRYASHLIKRHGVI